VDQAPAAEATYTLPALDPATADLLASSTPSAPATQDGGRLTVRVALAGDPDPLALALSATAHGVPLPAPDARLALLVRSASTSPAPPASSPREAALGPGRATWSDGAVRLALAWDGAGSRWSGPDGAVLSALDLGAGERAAAGTLRAEREAAEPMTTIAAPTGDLGLYGAGLAAVAVALGAPSLLRLRRA
jgi:hypothetical protein